MYSIISLSRTNLVSASAPFGHFIRDLLCMRRKSTLKILSKKLFTKYETKNCNFHHVGKITHVLRFLARSRLEEMKKKKNRQSISGLYKKYYDLDALSELITRTTLPRQFSWILIHINV